MEPFSNLIKFLIAAALGFLLASLLIREVFHLEARAGREVLSGAASSVPQTQLLVEPETPSADDDAQPVEGPRRRRKGGVL